MRRNCILYSGIFPAIVLSCVGLTFSATSQSAESGVSAAMEPFVVRPLQRAPAVMMPNARIPPPPTALDAGQREAAWQSVADGTDARPGESFELTAARPWIAEHAMMVLSKPQTMHPESAVEFTDDPAGMASVKIKVAGGGAYLVDFRVRARGPGSYRVAVDSSERVVDDPQGSVQHVLAGVRAEVPGWTTLRLRHSGSGYYLYAVEVTAAAP